MTRVSVSALDKHVFKQKKIEHTHTHTITHTSTCIVFVMVKLSLTDPKTTTITTNTRFKKIYMQCVLCTTQYTHPQNE